jgi:hypothetical protein
MVDNNRYERLVILSSAEAIHSIDVGQTVFVENNVHILHSLFIVDGFTVFSIGNYDVFKEAEERSENWVADHYQR